MNVEFRVNDPKMAGCERVQFMDLEGTDDQAVIFHQVELLTVQKKRRLALETVVHLKVVMAGRPIPAYSPA